MINIPKRFQDILVAYARSSEQEVCGFLSGNESRVVSLYVISNVAGGRDRFLMAEQEVVSALHLMESEGEELLAIWHSHPDGKAEPSLLDVREHNYPEVISIIIGYSSLAGFSLKDEKKINIIWGGDGCEC